MSRAGVTLRIVEVELVGSGDEVGAAFEAEVEDDDGAEGRFRSAGGGVVAEDALELVDGLAGLEAVEGAVGHDLGKADGAEEAGGAADVEGELFGGHGAEVGGAGDGVELGFVDGVVAAEEGDDGAEGFTVGVRGRCGHP